MWVGSNLSAECLRIVTGADVTLGNFGTNKFDIGLAMQAIWNLEGWS